MLNGPRIYLRTLEPSDAEHLLKWENNPDNWRVSDTRVPFSKHLIEQYVNSAQDLMAVKQIRFMICDNGSTVPVGSVDLFEYEPFHQHAGVGILITAPNRSKGYAQEALNLVSDYALNTIGLRNLHCTILANNKASLNLFDRAGYVQVGCKKNWFNFGGEWVDELTFQKTLVTT